MITLARLLTMCTYGQGRIVCTNDMTTLQIAEARKDGRMWVDENNFGYVLLPWDCACEKDLARDAQLFSPHKRGHADAEALRAGNERQTIDIEIPT